jgi:hypothetical protein
MSFQPPADAYDALISRTVQLAVYADDDANQLARLDGHKVEVNDVRINITCRRTIP